MQNHIGKYCVVRGDGSGVFAGVVAKHEGKTVTLNNAQRIWSWGGATETLGLATTGIKKPAESKVTVAVDELVLSDINTVIPCTLEAKASIKAVPIWTV
jgi:hypothetical protein